MKYNVFITYDGRITYPNNSMRGLRNWLGNYNSSSSEFRVLTQPRPYLNLAIL